MQSFLQCSRCEVKMQSFWVKIKMQSLWLKLQSIWLKMQPFLKCSRSKLICSRFHDRARRAPGKGSLSDLNCSRFDFSCFDFLLENADIKCSSFKNAVVSSSNAVVFVTGHDARPVMAQNVNREKQEHYEPKLTFLWVIASRARFGQWGRLGPYRAAAPTDSARAAILTTTTMIMIHDCLFASVLVNLRAEPESRVRLSSEFDSDPSESLIVSGLPLTGPGLLLYRPSIVTRPRLQLICLSDQRESVTTSGACNQCETEPWTVSLTESQ